MGEKSMWDKNVTVPEKSFTIPELMVMVGTRVAAGVGLGLLLAGRMHSDARKGAGWALLAVGALTTIPVAINLASKPWLVEKRAA